MKKKRIKIVVIAAAIVLIFLLAWNFLYKRALLIENNYQDLNAVMILYPNGEGGYSPYTIVDEEIVKDFYHTIEASTVRRVNPFTGDRDTAGEGPTIMLYFDDPDVKTDYYEGEYFKSGYTEVFHADSELEAEYEYGWRKYNSDDTMIIFTNKKLFTLMEKYVSETDGRNGRLP